MEYLVYILNDALLDKLYRRIKGYFPCYFIVDIEIDSYLQISAIPYSFLINT